MSSTLVRAPASIGSPITGGTDNEVLYINSSGNLAQSSNFVYNGKILLNGAADDGTTSGIIMYGSGSDTGQMMVLNHPYSGQPYMLIYPSDGSSALFGCRTGGVGFFQCSGGNFRIEAEFGGLAEITCNAINLASGTGLINYYNDGTSPTVPGIDVNIAGYVHVQQNGTDAWFPYYT